MTSVLREVSAATQRTHRLILKLATILFVFCFVFLFCLNSENSQVTKLATGGCLLRKKRDIVIKSLDGVSRLPASRSMPSLKPQLTSYLGETDIDAL